MSRSPSDTKKRVLLKRLLEAHRKAKPRRPGSASGTFIALNTGFEEDPLPPDSRTTV
jgi:hypothetical protein